MSVNEEQVTFEARGDARLTCVAPLLKGLIHRPTGDHPRPAAVICHPHPLYGGRMDNNVVQALVEGLAGAGLVTLRFNFRGVDGSGGQHDGGRGEVRDVLGAVDFLAAQREVDAARLYVVGYSFGAWMGLCAAAQDERVAAAAAVTWPKLGRPPQEVEAPLTGYTRPRLFVCGDGDQFAPLEWVRGYVEALPEPKALHVLPGADHFLWGREGEVAGLVVGFLTADPMGCERPGRRD